MPFPTTRRALLAWLGAIAPACAARQETTGMPHLVLLGDSVFDNRAYVEGGPDVMAHLRRTMPLGWQATLLALDGSSFSGVARQLERLPSGATHLIVSAGGNDALGLSSVLDAPSRSVGESLILLATAAESFRADYLRMLGALSAMGLPTAVCAIYDPRYPDPVRRRMAKTGLTILNDAILREAAVRGLPVLDLRLICDEDADFANPIEPSAQGGGKIAAAILALAAQHDFSRARSEIYIR